MNQSQGEERIHSFEFPAVLHVALSSPPHIDTHTHTHTVISFKRSLSVDNFLPNLTKLTGRENRHRLAETPQKESAAANCIRCRLWQIPVATIRTAISKEICVKFACHYHRD